MSATTEPAASAVEAAPPPPGTVVWSIFSWSELLADGPWLETRWAPVAGAVVDDRKLPDAQRAVLQGRGGGAVPAQRLVSVAGAATPEPPVQSVPLRLYMIR